MEPTGSTVLCSKGLMVDIIQLSLHEAELQWLAASHFATCLWNQTVITILTLSVGVQQTQR